MKMMVVRYFQWLGFAEGPLVIVGEGAEGWWRRLADDGGSDLQPKHLTVLKAMKLIAEHHLGPATRCLFRLIVLQWIVCA